MHDPKILLLGSSGQIGKAFLKKYKSKFKIFSPSRKKMDLSKNNFLNLIYKIKPSIIVNLAAYTNVEKAEIEKKKTKQINYLSVKKLVRYCETNETKLIHISSDYIFKSNKKRLISENEKKNPINFYGYTKYLSENAIINSKINYIILRTSWVFSEHNNNFVKKIINVSKVNKILKVVNDEYSKPTSANLLSDAICLSIYFLQKNNCIQEVFNVANKKVTSRYSYAKKIINCYYLNQKKPKIIPINSKDFKTLAKRSYYSALSSKKFEKKFNFKIDNWHNDLKKVIRRIK
jgi:dTDP-4-dehydrorhamnose reductase